MQNQAKILIIDDERLLRQSIKKILEKTGFYCETAKDYDSAKERINSLQFDLLLVDIVLPQMNGVNLVKKLQNECDLNAAIIFITGEPSLETSIKAIRVGAIDYLEKPVNRKALINSIKRSLLRRKKEIQIIENDKMKKVVLDDSFIDYQHDNISSDIINKLQESLDQVHNALLQLKKRYGEEFNEDQRTLLNIIAQNNSLMKKSLQKFEI